MPDKKSTQIKRAKSQNRRPTIGLLIDETSERISWDVWMGANDVAQDQGVNLICFVGGPLNFPDEFIVNANVVYDLVDPELVDGLVIWSGGLAQYVTPEELRTHCERYQPAPMVSAALPLRGIPSILTSNYLGMRDAILHLIKTHGHRRIAFIRGPEGHPEAEERYRAYRDVLAESGLSFEADRVAPGDFSLWAGRDAVELWINERHLLPQVDFEAIVAVDDITAFGAIEALQARGFQVPGDVAVVGFDDAVESWAATPPLTTVRQSTYQLGKQATETLLTLLAGGRVPSRVTLLTELVVRRSCGCLPQSVAQAAAGLVEGTSEAFETAFATRRAETIRVIQSKWAFAAERTAELLDAFYAELTGQKDPPFFLATLDEILQQAIVKNENIALWQNILSTMRRHILPCLVDRTDQHILFQAQDLWIQGQVMIGKVIQQAQVRQRLQIAQLVTLLQEISDELVSTFDLSDLVNELAQELPRLGISSYYISLYEPSKEEAMPPETSRMILARDERGQIELETDAQLFSTRQLAPDGILPRDKSYSILVLPLYFRNDQIGFVLFEAGPREGMIYHTLREQISSALKGILLLQKRQQAEDMLHAAYVEVEKQVDERTAELKQETAERERAQAESLRLQQEVIEAQKQTLRELSAPVIPVMDRIIVVPLIGSIDSARARDITRSLLAGIREHRAKIVILDVTGVPVVDSGVANHLTRTIQAARLKGAHTIVTGVSDAVAETIVDLGIGWDKVETMADLQTGLKIALTQMGLHVQSLKPRVLPGPTGEWRRNR